MQDKQKITLHLPADLHRQLKIRAAVDAESMSQIAERALLEESEGKVESEPTIEKHGEYKKEVTLYIPSDLHRQLKVRAGVDDELMDDIAERALTFYLSYAEVLDDEVEITSSMTAPSQDSSVVKPSRDNLEPHKQLEISIELDDLAPTDEVVMELAELCRAINSYHIACGGSGLKLDDWELRVCIRHLVGV